MESTVEEPRREPKRRLVALTGCLGLPVSIPLLEVVLLGLTPSGHPGGKA